MPETIDWASLAQTLGVAIVFIWIWYLERKRNSELHDRYITDLKTQYQAHIEDLRAIANLRQGLQAAAPARQSSYYDTKPLPPLNITPLPADAGD